MSATKGWNIQTRMLAISLGPALLLTLLLTGYFTYSRLQDLRQELTHTGQLIANQLAPAAEYGVLSGNLPILQSLLRTTLSTPHVRFIEVRNRNDEILVYAEQDTDSAPPSNAQIEVFHAPIQRERAMPVVPSTWRAPDLPDEPSADADYLGRVVVGMANDAFSDRQQEILFKASLLAFSALILTLLLARRLARRLAAPISTMANAVQAIQTGDYQTSLPVLDDGEIGDLARHINNLARALQQASQEQERGIAQLVAAREEAEQANRSKSDFLAMMSHELRTPMNGVLGMLQLLETTELNQEQAEYSALATESTEHLLKVINDILDFSRIERGALELERIPFNLLELIQGSVQVFQHSAQQRGLTLSLEVQEGLEQLDVRGDPTRLRQILVNLLGNALKFTEEGAIRLQVRWQPLDNEVLWLTCAVSDSGIGISAQRLEHMFEAFQQADSSTSRRYGGTGLGLAIARTLAERMGGTLNASSEEGLGSTFTLEIPLPFRTRHRVAPTGRPQAADMASGQSVLLVEDNPVNQTVIEGMLRSLGYSVTLVGDGVEAVRMAAQQEFDAILMDCRLPQLSGYEATRQIRARADRQGVPIIALTANALQGDREACLEAGMNDYLAKPFKRAELQKILQRWMT
ncbi:ATP-binding protein [Pseudomonas panipatensis]|uniref:Sensory/regulatory protein RpfC n=1 Tax=Pseudomonas panipatensis TaxID=428992 RepID=A0A1G8F404_9PSED|nr:ATP-binding protein [Pseudomonas panipatensis]SDH76851.1 Signal transduction histidine kinase [Pseudomonas panipatensis]SMP55510.1 Signal transduction histidine kinase [Pseudomonas panipatensis]